MIRYKSVFVYFIIFDIGFAEIKNLIIQYYLEVQVLSRDRIDFSTFTSYIFFTKIKYKRRDFIGDSILTAITHSSLIVTIRF